MNPYRVLVVEDQDIPRQLFELFIQSSERFELAASINNAAMADVYCAGGGIDLILMDVVTRNGANGLEAAQGIKRRWPQIKIIIVTSMPEYSYIERTRRTGVDSFWYKEISQLGRPTPDSTGSGSKRGVYGNRIIDSPGTHRRLH